LRAGHQQRLKSSDRLSWTRKEENTSHANSTHSHTRTIGTDANQLDAFGCKELEGYDEVVELLRLDHGTHVPLARQFNAGEHLQKLEQPYTALESTLQRLEASKPAIIQMIVHPAQKGAQLSLLSLRDRHGLL
jgi:hypothetical protein